MANRYENIQTSGVAEVSNSSGSSILIAAPGSTLYLYIESITISVSRAATGGGGEVLVQDTNGNFIWRLNADGVKDFALPLGEEGLRVGPGVGVAVSVGNAQGEQATASVAVVGHLAFR